MYKILKNKIRKTMIGYKRAFQNFYILGFILIRKRKWRVYKIFFLILIIYNLFENYPITFIFSPIG